MYCVYPRTMDYTDHINFIEVNPGEIPGGVTKHLVYNHTAYTMIVQTRLHFFYNSQYDDAS